MRTIPDVEDTENYFRPPYAKLKLDLVYKDGAPAFNVSDEKDGGRTEVALSSFKEALQYIRYTTKHRIAINFSKLYDMKTSSGKEKQKYGIVFAGNSDRVLEQDRPEVRLIH